MTYTKKSFGGVQGKRLPSVTLHPAEKHHVNSQYFYTEPHHHNIHIHQKSRLHCREHCKCRRTDFAETLSHSVGPNVLYCAVETKSHLVCGCQLLTCSACDASTGSTGGGRLATLQAQGRRIPDPASATSAGSGARARLCKPTSFSVNLCVYCTTECSAGLLNVGAAGQIVRVHHPAQCNRRIDQLRNLNWG